jgi:hypothetical protein
MPSYAPLAEASESADATLEPALRGDAPADVSSAHAGFGEVRFDSLGFVEFAIADLLAV